MEWGPHLWDEDENGCWVWNRSVNNYGYGIIWRTKSAHRVALALKLGRELGRGEVARHTCDNPPCVRPDHLVPGSQSQNIVDSVDRNRHHLARRTHCDKGHPLSGENLIMRTGGARRCRECMRDAHRRYYWRKKAGL